MPTCFVIMGFGKKTDPGTGKIYDLDHTYDQIIEPLAKKAGISCSRSDKIIHSGSINRVMYKSLFEADLVIADITTLNTNAIYELGVRHSIRRHATIIIAEENLTIPFDVKDINITRYKCIDLGDRHVPDAIELEKQLQALLEIFLNTRPTEVDSPVYNTITNLQPPKFPDKPVWDDTLHDFPDEDRINLLKIEISKLKEKIDDNDTLSYIYTRAEKASKMKEYKKASLLYRLFALIINIKLPK